VDALRPPGSAADSPGWRARVVPNRFPALPGMHEVIIHSPEHDVELEDLGDAGLAEVLDLWRRRIAAQLAAGAAATTLIVNRGREAGASLEHPHAQLVGTPAITPLLLDELLEFDRFANRHGGCVLCVEMESAGVRAVQDGPVRAWVPAAPRFPGELWLAPEDHAADFREADVTPVARALRRALVATRVATAGAPLNLWLHTAPADLRGGFHWHIEMAPRLTGIAGFELGAEIALVSLDPEDAARALREALPED